MSGPTRPLPGDMSAYQVPFPPMKQVPIEEAERLNTLYGQLQTIIFTWNGATTQVVTHGVTLEDSAQAAEGANILKRTWGWPADTIVESAKVQALRDRLEACEWVLRDLASSYGAGGYNADTVDPKVFERKIRDGVDHFIRSTITLERALAAPHQGDARTVPSASRLKVPAKLWLDPGENQDGNMEPGWSDSGSV